MENLTIQSMGVEMKNIAGSETLTIQTMHSGFAGGGSLGGSKN